MDQFLLNSKRCSGRGVRIRSLSPDEHDKLMFEAAKLVGPDATFLELKKIEWRMGVKKMLCEVTEKGGYKSEDELLKDGVKWKKVTVQFLDESFDDMFNAKDVGILQAIYRELHEVNDKEIDAIMGKALPVSEG